MKNTALYIFSLFLLIGLCSNSCEGKKDKMGEFVSEEAIFQKLETENPGLMLEHVCIDQIVQFETFFIAGFFAHDRGCGNNQYYYLGELIELNEENIQLILLNNGFKENPEQKIEHYNEFILNHNKSVLYSAPEVFEKGGHDFFAPKTWIENDQIISQMWIKRPSGMIPEHRFYMSEVNFDMEGKLISSVQKLDFNVPIK